MKRFIFLLLLTCLLSLIACAQTTKADRETGITGQVVDYELGAIIVGAKVSVSAKAFRQEARSDSNGRYKISVPNGVYAVEVEAPGFHKLRRKSVKIEGTGLYTFNVNMKVDERQRVDQRHP